MNKTESRFARGLEFMKEEHQILDHEFEPEKFRIADRTFLTPDFRIVLPDLSKIFVEVKGGFIREDAMVKLKTVAEHHPYAFFLAEYLKGEGWKIRRMPSSLWGEIRADIRWRI